MYAFRVGEGTVDTRLQPIYHTPGAGSVGYAGDPNGLVYRKDTGYYHFFWQRWKTWPSPPGVIWGHAISKDYAKWQHLPDVLSPGSFSGGATQLPDGGMKMLYKDTAKGNKFYTASPTNLSDPKLIEWEESPHESGVVGATDPSPGWPINRDDPNQGFYAVVGSLSTANETKGGGAVALWKADANFSNFKALGRELFAFPWDRLNGQGGPGDKYQSSVPRDPNFWEASSEGSSEGKGLYAFEGAMKMCFFAGHDFYVLGRYNDTEMSFRQDDPLRTMGSDPYDYGGSMFASQTFQGANGTMLTSSWVLEGDCNIGATGVGYPPKCDAMNKRGWEGVHSLPKAVTVETMPPLPGGSKPRHSLKFKPLPALSSLRTGLHSRVENVTSATGVKKLPEFESTSFHLDLFWDLPSEEDAEWEVGTNIFWSQDSREVTRVGMRSAGWMPGSELVFVNQKQQNASLCVDAANVTDPAECQKACKEEAGGLCIGWTALAQQENPSTGGGGAPVLHYQCRTVCHAVPLQAVSNLDCNWGDRHDPTHSVSGMMPGWASLYMDRQNSSLAVDTAGPAGYGTFGYAGLVRLLPEETEIKLSVFADKSIVEAFAMGGRSTLTGRVYPSLPGATSVGIYSHGADGGGVGAEGWELGAAFVGN